MKLFTKLANIIESGISSPFDCALLLRGASVLICQGRDNGDASELTKNYVRTAHTFTLARWHVENSEHIFYLPHIAD